jgi:hypothetical protein
MRRVKKLPAIRSPRPCPHLRQRALALVNSEARRSRGLRRCSQTPQPEYGRRRTSGRTVLFTRFGTKPLHADDRNEPVRQNAAHGGVGRGLAPPGEPALKLSARNWRTQRTLPLVGTPPSRRKGKKTKLRPPVIAGCVRVGPVIAGCVTAGGGRRGCSACRSACLPCTCRAPLLRPQAERAKLANSADLPLVTAICGGWCRVVRLVSPQSVEATLRPPVIFGCVGVAGAHGCVSSARSVGRFFSVRSACRSAGCLYNKTIGFEKPRRDSGRGGRHRLCGRFIAGKHQRADKEPKKLHALHCDFSL